MALTFDYSNHDPVTINLSGQWSRDIATARRYSGDILSIQADGHELEHIQTRFANLPYAHGVCTWRGEMARFILDNL